MSCCMQRRLQNTYNLLINVNAQENKKFCNSNVDGTGEPPNKKICKQETFYSTKKKEALRQIF